MHETALAERLITYDTSTAEGIRSAASFVTGWLGARDLPVETIEHDGVPIIRCDIGPVDAPAVIFHGHLDVVPGRPEQFVPRVEGDRLIGRGAYDMKGGLASMLVALSDLAAQDQIRVRFVCVPDEEASEVVERASDRLVREGFRAGFVITGEPTDLHIGVQAKGILAMRVKVHGKAAHSSTPWLGDNAVLKAVDVFRLIETLPFSRESSELFDRPSISLGRISGGDALNKVPDFCTMDVDIRYLPGQDPGEILAQVRRIDDIEIEKTFARVPAHVSRTNPFDRALADAIARWAPNQVMGVGRDGASDAVSFLEAGIPAVEFGPEGAGHHGPDEWVSIASLEHYRRALVDFVTGLPAWLQAEEGPDLRAVEGGLA
jgi:succinyl-diaminopimelate desuccinylase